MRMLAMRTVVMLLLIFPVSSLATHAASGIRRLQPNLTGLSLAPVAPALQAKGDAVGGKGRPKQIGAGNH